MIKQQKLFVWMSGAALVGLVASFWQMIDKLAILENKDAVLSCNLSEVFSCSNVLSSWQASLFGFPNSLIGIIIFTFFLSVALVGLTGSKLSRHFALLVQAVALFMFGFILWFAYQSSFVIQAICILCLFIGTATILINAVLLRLNVDILPISSTAKNRLKKRMESGVDIFVWALIWLAAAFTMFLKFT